MRVPVPLSIATAASFDRRPWRWQRAERGHRREDQRRERGSGAEESVVAWQRSDSHSGSGSSDGGSQSSLLLRWGRLHSPLPSRPLPIASRRISSRMRSNRSDRIRRTKSNEPNADLWKLCIFMTINDTNIKVAYSHLSYSLVFPVARLCDEPFSLMMRLESRGVRSKAKGHRRRCAAAHCHAPTPPLPSLPCLRLTTTNTTATVGARTRSTRSSIRPRPSLAAEPDR